MTELDIAMAVFIFYVRSTDSIISTRYYDIEGHVQRFQGLWTSQIRSRERRRKICLQISQLLRTPEMHTHP